MSGKRKAWTGTEEEYRAYHEAEMRRRFMQADIPGITTPAPRPQLLPALMPATLHVIRESVVELAAPEPKAQMAAPVARPDLPPAWYQRTARLLTARLAGAGFSIRAHNPDQHTITLTRADGSRITLKICEQISAWETVQQAHVVDVNGGVHANRYVVVR